MRKSQWLYRERQEGKHEQDERSHPTYLNHEKVTVVIHGKTGRETRTGREITPHVPKPSESHTGYTWKDRKGNMNRTRDHTPQT